MVTKSRRFGFPLLMLLGFAAGVAIAVVAALVMAPDGRRIEYTTLVKLLFALGALGAYLGHVLGAFRNKQAGIPPFGPLPTGAAVLGAAIVLLGSIAVFAAVLGLMTALYGPSPH